MQDLIPGKWSMDAWQRGLPARHGVVLIPKRVLARIVFARPSGKVIPTQSLRAEPRI